MTLRPPDSDRYRREGCLRSTAIGVGPLMVPRAVLRCVPSGRAAVPHLAQLFQAWGGKFFFEGVALDCATEEGHF